MDRSPSRVAMNLAAILALGFVLGMRHATDADHVVAVSTIVSRERTLRAAVPIGVLWGVGHTLTITLVGGAIILFGIVIPPRLGLGMEMCVGLMLVVLGALNVGTATGHAQSRPKGEALQVQPRRSLRPLGVGVVHGLAGSAAIALLVLGTIRDAVVGVVYLLVFGGGTIVGMSLITMALAAPVVVVAGRFEWLRRMLGTVAGLASVCVGAFLIHEIGFVHGLFTGHAEWTPQ
jgi:high-affinity nickel-transport protein